jgi:hypothetical protein
MCCKPLWQWNERISKSTEGFEQVEILSFCNYLQLKFINYLCEWRAVCGVRRRKLLWDVRLGSHAGRAGCASPAFTMLLRAKRAGQFNPKVVCLHTSSIAYNMRCTACRMPLAACRSPHAARRFINFHNFTPIETIP